MIKQRKGKKLQNVGSLELSFLWNMTINLAKYPYRFFLIKEQKLLFPQKFLILLALLQDIDVIKSYH